MATDPTLAEILRIYSDAMRHAIRVALPARVITFDPEQRSVSARIELRPRRLDDDGDPTLIRALPDFIVDVPVSFPTTRRVEMTLRLEKDDPGHVLFHDYGIGSWIDSGGLTDPPNTEAHGLSGAVFVPGLCSSTDRPDPLPAGVELRVGLVGDTALEIHGTGVIKAKTPGGSSDKVATLTDVTALRDWISANFAATGGHTHVVVGGSTTTITTVSPPGGSPAPSIPPTPAGTDKFESE